MNLYLDIEGVILNNNKEPARHLLKFLVPQQSLRRLGGLLWSYYALM
jgi:hypothetical protein